MKHVDQYAVFGHPISHSKSPRIHRLFAEQTGQQLDYTAQEVVPEHFEASVARFFREGGQGLNCTVPLKELAWRQADELTDRARLSQAVNTLALQFDGRLLGDNTDGVGLLTDLSVNHAIALPGLRILVLGAGGASRGIVGPLLEQQPAQLVVANRSPGKAEALVAHFAALGPIAGCGFQDLPNRQFDLIINATSASLSGELPPLPKQVLRDGGFCYDLAYANQATAFVKWGKDNGAAKSLDGLGMLVEQAAAAFFLWRDVHPETQAIIKLLNDERSISVRH